MQILQRQPYKGDSRRLLIAFDIGTTFSGVSYSILDPGNIPDILPVTRFPDQEQVGGDSKVPTVIYYDSEGEIAAIGAETLRDGLDAEENGWTKATWFKMHLRPLNDRVKDGSKIPDLPPGKTVISLFSDYMRYLFNCAKEFITSASDGISWKTLESDIIFVFTHPNGWEGPQQASMRKAAIEAGLVPDTLEGHERVIFVTEGEASLHFCLSRGLKIQASETSGVIIVDAGGGTIDVTSYRQLPDELGSFEEIAAAQCYFQGAIYVTTRANEYFKDRLGNHRDYADTIPHLTNHFDRRTKHVFKDLVSPACKIPMGMRVPHNPGLGVRASYLEVPNSIMATFFEPSVDCIVKAILAQIATSHFPIKSVFLVGGFSASAWLFNSVQSRISALNIGVSVFRPDAHTNKAVANGAVSFYLDSVVKSRVSRFSYGTLVYEEFDLDNPKHSGRAHLKQHHSTTGETVLHGKFCVLLPKGTRVAQTKEFRDDFCTYRNSPTNATSCIDIVVYRGLRDQPPYWRDEDANNFVTFCEVKADLSRVVPVRCHKLDGSAYWRFPFEIILLFGLTEFKAQLAYMENGNEKRSPATIIYM